MKTTSAFKTVLFAIMLILTPAIFTGCFGGDNSGQTPTMDETVQVKKIGILKSLGGMSIGDGTHLLELDDGSTIRLKSLNINLDSVKYLNNKVEVKGPITKTSDGKDLMEVRSIDVAEEIKTTETVVPGQMKEYKNTDLGIKLTYLDNWQVKEQTNTVTFTAPIKPSDETTSLETDNVAVTRYSNPEKRSLESFLNLPTDANELSGSGYTQTKIGVDQLNGLKKQSADQSEIDNYLSRNEYIYKISFTGTNTADVINNRNAYFSMISSFQFIALTTENPSTETTTDKPTVETSTTTTTTTSVEEDTVNNTTTEEPDDSATGTTTTTTTTTTQTTAPASSSYGIVSQYIAQTINTVAPEASTSGSWTAYSFEFAKPNYVYVIYGNGTEKRRVLLTYEQVGAQLETSVVGYFTPGETTTWSRVSGNNPVESAEKTVVTLSDGSAQEAAVVKEGYRYFESSPYHFQAQYPSNWYYSGSGTSGDTLHHYGFSNQPVENGNEMVSIDIVSGSIPAGSAISVGSNQGVKVVSNGETSIYIQREDGSIYKIHGPSGNETYIVDIASSIQKN